MNLNQIVIIITQLAPLASLVWSPRPREITMDRPPPSPPDLTAILNSIQQDSQVIEADYRVIEDSYCPACETQKQLAIARGYLEGLIEHCEGEVPKGLGGTMALARVTIDDAQGHLDTLSQKGPEPAIIASKLRVMLPVISRRLAWVSDCDQAREIAALVQQAWSMAYQAAVAIYAPGVAKPSCPT